MIEYFIVFADLPSWKVVKNALVNSEKSLSHGEKCLTNFFKLGRSAYGCICVCMCFCVHACV